MAAKIREGETMLQVKVQQSTRDQLEALAGGPRSMGRYLDEIVPMLYEAQQELEAAVEEARRQAVAEVLAKQFAEGKAENE